MLLNTFDLIAFDTADVDNPTVHICTNESLIIGTDVYKRQALVIQPEHPEPGTNIIISVESRLKVLFCNA